MADVMPRRSLVIGLGQTGQAVCDFLLEHTHDEVILLDIRRTEALADWLAADPRRESAWQPYQEASCQGADRAFVSPGIPYHDPMIAALTRLGIPLMSDLDLLFEHSEAPCIGITGTNGKSTVSTLVGALLEAQGWSAPVVGNIGQSPLACMHQEPDFWVLELSSAQCHYTRHWRLQVGVLLNLSPDHLDWHRTMAHYVASKLRVLEGCETPVLNRDEPWTRSWLSSQTPRVTFGNREPSDDWAWGVSADGQWVMQGAQRLLPLSALGWHGGAPALNAAAALAIGQVCGCDTARMLDVLSSFKGLSHRCQWVRTLQGVDWYNDSKATNAHAAWATLEALQRQLDRPIIVILGGMLKEGDAALWQRLPVGTRAVLYGQGRHALMTYLPEGTVAGAFEAFEAAVQRARDLAQAGDVVLLAPGGASFDQFRHFQERGRHFEQMVQGWST